MARAAPLAREAALPGRNFNVAARDRRFLPRLAVPPFPLTAGACFLVPISAEFAFPAACLSPRPRLELAPTAVTQITHHGAWRGGRVVECTALEMRHRCKPIGGSNPSLSARLPAAMPTFYAWNQCAMQLSQLFRRQHLSEIAFVAGDIPHVIRCDRGVRPDQAGKRHLAPFDATCKPK